MKTDDNVVPINGRVSTEKQDQIIDSAFGSGDIPDVRIVLCINDDDNAPELEIIRAKLSFLQGLFWFLIGGFLGWLIP